MKIRSSLLPLLACLPAGGLLLPHGALAETSAEASDAAIRGLAQTTPATTETPNTSSGASSVSAGNAAPTGGAAPNAAGTVTSGAPSGAPSGVQGKPASGGGEAPITYGSRQKLLLLDDEAPSDPKAYTLTLGGGASFFDGTLDTSTCGVVTKLSPSSPGFRAQLGRTWFSQLQLQLDLGLSSDSFYACSASDSEDTGSTEDTEETESSGEVVNLSLFAFSLGLAYRFDYFDEQPLVPYVAAGLSGDVLTLTDTTYVDETLTETALGHRLGMYAGFGLEVLLDTFGPARAADLELSSGINDSYVVLDARYVWKDRYLEDGALNTTTALAFYGWQVTGGLKFDF